MARIQTPQVIQEARAEFKVRGDFDLELLETVQPTYQVSRRGVASTAYPRECMGRVADGAGAGANGQCAITGRTGQGKIYVVDSVQIDVLLTSVYQLRIDSGTAIAAAETESVSKRFTDTRLGAAPLPDAFLSSSTPLTAAPDGLLVGSMPMLANTFHRILLGVVLAEGTYFLVRNLTANEAMSVTYFWTEFLLEDR